MATDMILDNTPCPIVDSLKQIGSQWRFIVLCDLQDGGKRFNGPECSTGVSLRTLSRVLDDLWEHNFADHQMEEDAPVAAYYSLIDKGASLRPVFDEIQEWAIEWLDVERKGSVEGETVQSTA